MQREVKMVIRLRLLRASLLLASSACTAALQLPSLRLLTEVQFQLAVGVTGTSNSALTGGVDFEIRSAGPGKGRGAFALRELPAEAYLARYTGRFYDRLDAWKAKLASGETSGDFCYLFEDGGILDAEDASRSGWPRFVNHSKRRKNCEFIEVAPEPIGPLLPPRTVVMLQATRWIAAGEELLVDYGDGYWDGRVGKVGWQRFVIDYL